jgi:hypothetical protein
MNTAQSNETAATSKRARRTPEEVRQDRLAREARLAQKAEDRKNRLLAQAAKADERAKKALERQTQIENNVSTRVPKEPLPTIKEPVAKRVQREVATFMKELGAKHGLNFDGISPRMTRRGSGLSFHITGTVQGVASAVRRVAGATREATRFMEFHKLVGIKASLLNKEVQLSNEQGSFKVLGLKGRAHDVVLQKVGSDDVMTMAADEFRQRMVTQ